MANKITRGYVNHYQTIKMVQTLPSGRHVFVEYIKIGKDKWTPKYSTDSAYHICPYDGRFQDCIACEAFTEALNDEMIVKNCQKHTEEISSTEMAQRAAACSKAPDCMISFMGY